MPDEQSDAMNHSDELDGVEGSEEDVAVSRSRLNLEWNALSYEERTHQYESFERMCRNGLGDTHRFYLLLMPHALVGYVGD